MVLSFVLAAFSSLRLVVSKRTTSVMTELLGPGNQRDVAADLEMFDGLRTGNDRGIKHGLVCHFAGHLIGFLDQTIDGRALDTARLLLELQKHLVQPLDLLVGLLQSSDPPRDRGWSPCRSSSAMPS